jgi:carbonic anhydrase
MNFDRRAFLLQTGAGLTLAATGAASAAPVLAPPHDASSALAALMAGNARFVADKAACPPLTARRLELAEGQSPFAIIVSCSDSRVPVETVFDQIPGNIFGIRIAGNFMDRGGVGSIEYAVAVLKSPLILVLGHSECGAVKAALAYAKDQRRNQLAQRGNRRKRPRRNASHCGNVEYRFRRGNGRQRKNRRWRL